MRSFMLNGSFLVAGLLSACGGGGGSDTQFPSQFYGAWSAESVVCGSNAVQGTDGTVYSSIDRFTTLSETRSETTADLYQGLTCTTKVGTLLLATQMKWSQVSIAGKQIAARIQLDPNYQVTATQTNGTPIALKTQSGGVTTEKSVVAIDSGVLFYGDVSSSSPILDADGYPTVLLRYGPKK